VRYNTPEITAIIHDIVENVLLDALGDTDLAYVIDKINHILVLIDADPENMY